MSDYSPEKKTHGALAGLFKGWAEWFQNVGRWQMVAVARFALAVFALLAIYTDPIQPVRHDNFAYFLLTFYALYAGAVALAAMRGSPGPVTALVIHGFDIAVFSALIHLTEGPTSPLFVLFTFALFSATLRWNWQGAAATAILIIVVYGALASIADIEQNGEISRTIMRSAYLVVAGILFLYLGARLERERLRYARLAAWPGEFAAREGFPGLDGVLAHLSRTANVPRLMVMWEDPFEPHSYVAWFAHGAVHYAKENVHESDAKAPSGASRSEADIPTDLLLRHGIHDPTCAPLRGASHTGWLFLSAGVDPGDDLSPLAAIAALRISSEIEQHYLRLKLVDSAVRQGRSQLARDIHDDVLQSLTATGLRLKSLEAALEPDERQKVVSIRKSIMDQQAKLRQFVSSTQDGDSAGSLSAPIKATLNTMLAKMEEQWNCEAELSVTPDNLVVSQRIIDSLSLFLAEAIANGVRHGQAKKFWLWIDESGNDLLLRIEDDGIGIPGLSGAVAHDKIAKERIGSLSLMHRAAELRGEMTLSNSGQGLELRLKMPSS